MQTALNGLWLRIAGIPVIIYALSANYTKRRIADFGFRQSHYVPFTLTANSNSVLLSALTSHVKLVACSWVNLNRLI